jgi:dual specificity MAP kinase phosphatase
MCDMAKASEISNNVWLGPSPDVLLSPGENGQPEPEFDVLIEASDLASLPGPRVLQKVTQQLGSSSVQRLMVQFPSSGSIIPPSDHNRDVDDFVNTIRWIYYLANPEETDTETDTDGDVPMASSRKEPRKILIHCADGYTESSLLAVAYFMFAEGVPVHEAWLRLHREKGRNFFAYPSDVTLLRTIQLRLLQESPAAQGLNVFCISDPVWLDRMDGSLPSRILPYMYLGNLAHANNPQLLWALGIRRILSIGEPVTWDETELEQWGDENLMYIDQVQDNGIDPLTQEFDRCLSFIGGFRLSFSVRM